MEFSVGIDVGARSHHIAIVDPDSQLSESFVRSPTNKRRMGPGLDI